MSVEPLLELMSEKLIDFLNLMKDVFVTMNVLLGRYRISESNKRGSYEHPFAISTAGTGKVIFLKVTGYLRGCPSRKKIFARCLKCNNHKLYISTKLMKCTIQ